ncbi:MAG: integral membrane-like protein, partial [Chthoniobacterales bacterium]
MWAPSLLWGHSAWYDLIRMVEFDAAIRAGYYLPSWSPDLYRGYGSPLFQFYSPLAYFITEIPVLAGFDIPTALKIANLLLLIGSGVAMYHL